jgi:hypothetical protein
MITNELDGKSRVSSGFGQGICLKSIPVYVDVSHTGTGSKLRREQAFLGFEYEAEGDNDVTRVEGFNGRLLRNRRISCAEFARET